MQFLEKFSTKFQDEFPIKLTGGILGGVEKSLNFAYVMNRQLTFTLFDKF